MLQISEWLPNPAGADAKGEWVELQNTGASSVQTAGWFLKNEKGARASLPSKTILPGEFLVLKRPDFSLPLRNTKGGLALFDSTGHLADQAQFLGTAPEGKSFGRTASGFLWLTPTPGTANNEAQLSLVGSPLPLNAPLHQAAFPWLPALLFPILITGFVLYTVKQDAGLSQLLFSGNETSHEDDDLAFMLEEEGGESEEATPQEDFVSKGRSSFDVEW